jgi:hypothetical protein
MKTSFWKLENWHIHKILFSSIGAIFLGLISTRTTINFSGTPIFRGQNEITY